VNDWVPALASAILADRVDRGCTQENALARAQSYAAWLEDLERVPHDRATCPDEEFIRRWRGEFGLHTGQASVLVAKQGAGKSNTMAYLIERAIQHRPEWDIYSNLPFPWDTDRRGVVPSPPRLYPVRSLSSLVRQMCTRTIPAGRIPAVFVDETDQSATSHSWAQTADESWMRFLYVERHFRVRGPMLVYHFYEHVPLPLRQQGALRGSYFRVVVRGGRRRLACVEDTSRWFGVGETRLPYYNLGLSGFDLDVDMKPLTATLNGSLQEMATQAVAYLDSWEQSERDDERVALEESRRTHFDSIANRNTAIARRDVAFEKRNEEIVHLLVKNAKTTNEEIRTLYLTNIGSALLARLRAEAAQQRGEAGAGNR
jgi:hypothetical protein